MTFFKKIWATLAGRQQRPDPQTANADIRAEVAKDINREREDMSREHEKMQQAEQPLQEPTVTGPSSPKKS